MIRLVIVDQSSTKKKSWQISLQNEPDLTIVGFIHDGQAAIHYIKKIKPDIVIMNINLPIMDGITITRIISQRHSNIQVILITSKDSHEEFNRAVEVGARGYLLHSTKIKEIINVIRLVHQGYFHLDSSLAQKYIFKKSVKKYTKSKNTETPPKAKIAHIFDGGRFFNELQAIRAESRQIRLILRKFEIRLKFLHKFLFFLILIIFILVVAIIVITDY